MPPTPPAAGGPLLVVDPTGDHGTPLALCSVCPPGVFGWSDPDSAAEPFARHLAEVHGIGAELAVVEPEVTRAEALAEGYRLPVVRDAEVIEGEVIDDPLDAHAVKATDRGAIVALVCRCGEWEAAAGGPSSLAWAARDHRRHVTEAVGRG